MIYFKNVKKKLLDAGWTKERLLSEISEEKLSSNLIELIFLGREKDYFDMGNNVSTTNIDTICHLCHCQPRDIIGYMPSDES